MNPAKPPPPSHPSPPAPLPPLPSPPPAMPPAFPATSEARAGGGDSSGGGGGRGGGGGGGGGRGGGDGFRWSAAALVGEVGAGSVGALGLLLALVLLASRAAIARAGYSGLRPSGGGGGKGLRVAFELSNGLREDGELSLSGVRSVKQLRIVLLQLADELLLDPEDDLGEWTLRYTDRSGELLPVTPTVSIGELSKRAIELRVTAGRSLRAGARQAAAHAQT